MSVTDFTPVLTKAITELSGCESYKGLIHQHADGIPLPSGQILQEIIELTRSIIFPGYFGPSTLNSHTIRYHIGTALE